MLTQPTQKYCFKIYVNYRKLTCSAKNENTVNIINVASTQWVQNFNLSRYALLFKDKSYSLIFTISYCAYVRQKDTIHSQP